MAIEIAEVLGFTANILSNIAFLPQIIKTFRKKRVDDISIGMFCVLLATNVCWIGYAIPMNASNLWVSCVIELCLLMPIFAMWMCYRKRPIPVNEQDTTLTTIPTPYPVAMKLHESDYKLPAVNSCVFACSTPAQSYE